VAVGRCHLIRDKQVLFARQHPGAIDAGVFHNDVISVGNENVLLVHERAWEETPTVIRTLQDRYRTLYRGAELFVVRVPSRRVPMGDAVKSYLFNSQLVTLGPDRMALIAPVDCREVPSVRDYLDDLVARARTPLQAVHYVDLRQSMRNGGGPACLRLRVVLTEAEWAALPTGVRFTPPTHAALVSWVKRHYRERLTPADLADPALLRESRRALDELTRILGLGAIYPFQQE
jgi:succinylarginine dihydrolase